MVDEVCEVRGDVVLVQVEDNWTIYNCAEGLQMTAGQIGMLGYRC